MPSACPVNTQAKTRRRSSEATHRSTSTDWAGAAAVTPMPKTNMPARKATG